MLDNIRYDDSRRRGQRHAQICELRRITMDRIEAITREMLSHGVRPDLPVAVVRRATTSQQETIVGTLENIAQRVVDSGFEAPAGVVLGEVVLLRGALNWFEPFREVKPAATIQHGVYVYQGRFAVPLMSALVDVRETGELISAGQPAAALAKALEAVSLAPDSAITQINLADTLAAQEQWSGALIHYRKSGELARTVRPELQDESLVPRSDAGIEAAERHLREP